MKRTVVAGMAFAGLLATVVAANWALQKWGVVSIGFGLMAPAGVFFVGLAFGLRDLLHEVGGRIWVFVAIAVGAGISYLISDGSNIPGGVTSIAVASGVAFLFSETSDFAVYSPLRKRHLMGAVIASNIVGSVVDSALFLWLAFGSLDFMVGQIVGKAYMILPVLPIVWLVRRKLGEDDA